MYVRSWSPPNPTVGERLDSRRAVQLRADTLPAVPPGERAFVTETTTASPPQRAALSRELSEFLVELSIGVHRYAMYPAEHPSLKPVVENIVGRLAELFEGRRSLSIGVAQRQLVIEGVATDQRHPVLSDLARRLHEHQLGALSFEVGVTASEVSGLLSALARETERGGTPLGLLPAEDSPDWEHAHFFRVGYDRLELRDGDAAAGSSAQRAAALWLGLAQAALASEEPLEEAPDAAAVARAVAAHPKDSAYDKVIVGYLLQLAEELKRTEGEESEKVRRRVSKLIGELDDTTLERLVGFGGNAAQRRRFMLDANQSLAVDSVVKVLHAAASGPEQSISHSMTRLLTKLAAHAEQGSASRRSQADTALRENVEALISGWELRDPNPEAYTNVLDAMSRAAPIFQTPDEEGGHLTGAERLVQTALELDAWGPIVERALADFAARGGAGQLLAMIRALPATNRVAARVRQHLTAPDRFRRLLAGGQLDDAALRGLVEEMGSGAVDPLLDVLGDSDDRSVRRRVFDALARMGPVVGQRTIERLSDPRWFVLRNMLALLARLEDVPGTFDPQPFVEHADARVRREAFPLALRSPRLRDRVLVAALSDPDERMVRMALLEVQNGVPDPVLPTLVNRVVSPAERSSEIRTMGVKVLGASRSPLVGNTLVELVSAGKTIFGKPRLAAASPEVLQALRVLATRWSDRPDARHLLQEAARSRDADVRGAVRVGKAAPDGSGHERGSG